MSSLSAVNWADIVIVSVLFASVVVSLIRGFVKEAISLSTWCLAAWLGLSWCQPLSLFIVFTEIPTLKVFLAFLGVFICVIFMGAMVNYAVGKMVRKTPFSVPDRILGSVFGLFRGGLVVSIVVLLAGLTPFPNDPWWQASLLVPNFQLVAEWFQQQLPADIAAQFVFPTSVATRGP